MYAVDALSAFHNNCITLVTKLLFLLSVCVDINECVVADNGGCNQSCVNTPGSYHCLCSEGYALENDNHSCTG